MADNVSITPGSGETVAADDVSGVKYQVVKIGLGAENAVDMHLDSGQQTKANSLPVTLASDSDVIKAEDAVHSSGDKGIMSLAVRKDVAASLAGADGDYAPLEVDTNGALHTRAHLNHTYRFYSGTGTGTCVGPNNDIVFQRADNPTFPLDDVISTGPQALDYLDTDDALFDDTPIWFYVPIVESGWAKASILIQNATGVNIGIDAYQLTGNINFASVGALGAHAYKIVGPVASSPYTVPHETGFRIGIGVSDDDVDANRIASCWTFAGLLVKMEPASDPPAGGHLNIAITRSL